MCDENCQVALMLMIPFIIGAILVGILFGKRK